MEFNTQVCTTKEQSERLLALELKKETADMTLVVFDDTTMMELIGQTSVSRATMKIDGTVVQTEDLMHIPAWSLHRLMAMISNIDVLVDPDGYEWACSIFVRKQLVKFVAFPIEVKTFDDNDNLYDNIIDCIEWLIKDNQFNKQYLNENL